MNPKIIHYELSAKNHIVCTKSGQRTPLTYLQFQFPTEERQMTNCVRRNGFITLRGIKKKKHQATTSTEQQQQQKQQHQSGTGFITIARRDFTRVLLVYV